MQEPSPRSVPEPSPQGQPAWPAILGAGSPREVLARLIDGDPLGLEERCRARLRTQAVLMELERLVLRTTAHVARDALAYRGAPHVDIWLAERVRRSLLELLAEDKELLRGLEVDAAPGDPWLLRIAELLGIEPALLARGCASFNGASHEVRTAFFGIVLDGQSPAAWAKANGATPERARTSVKRALWMLGLRDELDVEELLGEDEDEP